MNKYFFLSGNFLLPNKNIDYTKWSVISCDQHTSNLEYWKKTRDYVGLNPSSLYLTMPELQVDNDIVLNARQINNNMVDYLNDGILEQTIIDGLVLVERETTDGIRIGLVGLIDLDEYSYTDNKHLIVATEDCVLSRLKKRVEIRENALLELSHAIVFINDKTNLIENAYNLIKNDEPLYDFDLMNNSGHIRGFKVLGDLKNRLLESINKRDNDTDPILLVGDGNHSLAAAKECWNNYKNSHPNYNINHPLRYAMVELENVNSIGDFYPIHRYVYDVDIDKLINDFNKYLNDNNIIQSGDHKLIFKSKNKTYTYTFSSPFCIIKSIQRFFDINGTNYVYKIDYLHDIIEVNQMIDSNGGVGVILEKIDKDDLFKYVKESGHLPKKSFSIGEADDKRFYLESRIIK